MKFFQCWPVSVPVGFGSEPRAGETRWVPVVLTAFVEMLGSLRMCCGWHCGAFLSVIHDLYFILIKLSIFVQFVLPVRLLFPTFLTAKYLFSPASVSAHKLL